VRKAGGRVRVTAQLIKADDGYHVWSQTYDRELTDIFAIQTEISNAIAEALNLRLTAQQRLAGKRDAPTSNMDAYEAYLLGRHELTKNEPKKAIEHLQAAVGLDPQFAPAYAALARAIVMDSKELADMNFTAEREAAIRRSEEILARAQALDPGHPEVLAVAGFLESWRSTNERALERALELYEKSLAINPSDGEVLTWRNRMLWQLGRYDQLLAASAEAVKRDPLSLAALNFRIYRLLDMGRRGEAGPVVERLRSLDEVRGQYMLAHLALYDGDRPGEIRHCIDAIKAGGTSRGCGWNTFAALELREEALSRQPNPAAGQYMIGEYAEAARLARIAAQEDPIWWEWDLVHWLWMTGDFEGAWQFSVQARESDRKGAGYTGWGRSPLMLLSAADSARRVGKLEDARHLRDQAAALLEAENRAAKPFTADNDVERAMLHAYDGRQDDAAVVLIAALPRGLAWRTARDYPLFEEVRKRPDFQAAMRRQQVTLDRQRDEVLQILCGPVPPPEMYKPAPETCAMRNRP
jgi:tetratricopeptide (TPR) repeat protein